MLLALYVLIVTTLLVGAAYVAVLGDSGLSRNDLDQKRAYAAAEAGIAAYNYDLNQNPNYWESCPTPSGTIGASDSGSTETYAITPVPATGYTSCSSSNISSMIEASGTTAAGTFRIASTGTSNNVSRTVVAQYARDTFLNYVYFSNYEDSDPQWNPNDPTASPTCAAYAWQGRSGSCASTAFGSGDSVNGPLHTNDNLSVCTGAGNTTTFGRTGVSPADSIESANTIAEGTGCTGTLVMNGTPNTTVGTLTLPPNDTQLLAVADGGVSTQTNGCYSGAGCVFTGPTTIVIDGPTSAGGSTNDFTVTNSSYNGGAATTLAFPSDGVIYVNATTSCSYAYSPFGSENQLYGGTSLDSNSADTDNAGCGDAVVEASSSASSCPGTTRVSGVCPYTSSLTIGAADDIIIASSLTTTTTTSGCAGGESSCPTGSATLGLIADHNVRVFHPLGSARYSGETEQSCLSATGGTQDAYLNTNGTGSLINPVVDAAIFAVNDSFMIDNFDCGSQSNANGGGNAPTALGTLTVNGTIAQNFRGRVAEGNPQVSGYTKNYWYDGRLASVSPPSFLDPVGTTWIVQRETECDGTASC
jgi:hypothetical protein